MKTSKLNDAIGEMSDGDGPPIFARLLEIARASALEEMASGIAHELNQPLGAIATYAQAGERMLGKSEPMVTAAIDVLKQINKEALGAGDGIRRIRKLFNREPAQKVRGSVGELLRELKPVLQMSADRAGVALEFDAAAPVPDVNIDRLRIQHVLFTLVQNALEASKINSARPPIVKIAIASDRYSVEVSVTDSGSGIPSDAEQQIFRPFFTTKSNGTGLGLASSRAIVEQHEGSIGFKSTVDGTRFWFTLPAVVET